MSKQKDDLEAVRIIADALKDFEKNDQERIIRWACERVGLNSSASLVTTTVPQRQPTSVDTGSGSTKFSSIKEFIDSEDPRKNTHFAAAVAYYYRFEASEENKKDTIGSGDLIEACRLSGRRRFKEPIVVLNNTVLTGLLDRPGRGSFKINAVGENLVAMGLPAGSNSSVGKGQPRKRKRKKKTK